MSKAQFRIPSLNCQYDFFQIDNYQITSDIPLENKICYSTLCDIQKDLNSINFLVLIDSTFRLIMCNYNSSDYHVSKDQEYIINHKIEDRLSQLSLVKMIYSKALSNTFIFLATKTEIFFQALDNIKSFTQILNLENIGTITDMYCFEILDIDNLNNYLGSSKIVLFVVINNKIIIELLPFSKTQEIVNSSHFIIFEQGKIDKKKYNKYSFISQYDFDFTPYQVIKNLDETKLFQSLITFESSVLPLQIIFRPGGKKGKNNYCINFENGFLGVFHYETHALVSIYKTSYGNICSINFSQNGKLLVLGCEDDNIYIADAESNSLLYCLQGHDNYVSSVCFEAKCKDIEVVPDSIKSKETTISKYQDKIDMRELFENINQINLDLPLDVNILNKNRSSKFFSNKNLRFLNKPHICSSYSLFSSSYDGTIATWQIDHTYDPDFVNPKNYYKIESEINKLDNILKTVSLDLSKEKLLTPISKLKVSNTPIFHMTIINNVLIYLGKHNHDNKCISFRLFFSKISKELHYENLINQTTAVTNSTPVKYKQDNSMNLSKNKIDLSVATSTTSTNIKIKPTKK